LSRWIFLLATTFVGIRFLTISAIRIRVVIDITIGRRIRGVAVRVDMLAVEGLVAIGRVIRMAVVVPVTAVGGLVIQVVMDGPVPEVPLVALFPVRLVITKPGVVWRACRVGILVTAMELDGRLMNALRGVWSSPRLIRMTCRGALAYRLGLFRVRLAQLRVRLALFPVMGVGFVTVAVVVTAVVAMLMVGRRVRFSFRRLRLVRLNAGRGFRLMTISDARGSFVGVSRVRANPRRVRTVRRHR
jgi:hypothetical protein